MRAAFIGASLKIVAAKGGSFGGGYGGYGGDGEMDPLVYVVALCGLVCAAVPIIMLLMFACGANDHITTAKRGRLRAKQVKEFRPEMEFLATGMAIPANWVPLLEDLKIRFPQVSISDLAATLKQCNGLPGHAAAAILHRAEEGNNSSADGYCEREMARRREIDWNDQLREGDAARWITQQDGTQIRQQQNQASSIEMASMSTTMSTAKVYPMEHVSPPTSPPATRQWPEPHPFIITIPEDEQLAEPEERCHSVGIVMRTTVPVGCTGWETFPVMTAHGAYEVACPPGVPEGEEFDFLLPIPAGSDTGGAPEVAMWNGLGPRSLCGSAALGGVAPSMLGSPTDAHAISKQGGRSKAE